MSTSFAALEAFYWVAHLNSFSAAGEHLNVTQPTVSYRIRELEERLGVQLLVRRGRRISLTSEGESLRGYAEQMIGLVQDIEANIRSSSPGSRTLRLGVIDSFAALCLPLLLDELKLANTRVATTVDHSHNLARLLSEGALDMAILSTPPSYPNVNLQLLGRQGVDWVASPDLGLGSERISPGELLRQRVFCTPAPSNLHQLTISAFSGSQAAGIKLNLCNSIAVIHNLVRAGVGICVLPTRLVQDDLYAHRLTVLDIGGRLPMQDVFIGTNKGIINRSLPAVIQLVQNVGQEMAYCM